MSELDAVLTDHADGDALTIVVVPRASKTGIDRIDSLAIRVRVAAPPVEGAANAALLRYLADLFDLPRSNVRLLAGATSRRKRVLLAGASRADVVARLTALTAG